MVSVFPFLVVSVNTDFKRYDPIERSDLLLDKITERLYPSHRKGTFGRENERLENGCVLFRKEGGMDVMNVVVRETEPPCKATDLELLGLVEVYSPALML